MKKLIILLFLIPTFAFAGGDKEESNASVDSYEEVTSIDPSSLSSEELKTALEESNLLLEQAYREITNKTERIKELEKEVESLEVELASCSTALKDSNIVLDEAYNRIEEDQKEIEDLRQNVQKLIDAGVEIQTPTWNVNLLVGYPAIAGGQVGFNFPFMPQLGVTAGALYSFEEAMPYITAGVKLNIDID